MDKLSVVFRRFSCLPFRKPPAYLDKSTNFLKGQGMKSLVLICLRYNGIRDSEIMELLENMLSPILAYLSGETQDKNRLLQGNFGDNFEIS